MPSWNKSSTLSSILALRQRLRNSVHNKNLVIRKRIIPESLVTRPAGQGERRLWERDWWRFETFSHFVLTAHDCLVFEPRSIIIARLLNLAISLFGRFLEVLRFRQKIKWFHGKVAQVLAMLKYSKKWPQVPWKPLAELRSVNQKLNDRLDAMCKSKAKKSLFSSKQRSSTSVDPSCFVSTEL